MRTASARRTNAPTVDTSHARAARIIIVEVRTNRYLRRVPNTGCRCAMQGLATVRTPTSGASTAAWVGSRFYTRIRGLNIYIFRSGMVPLELTRRSVHRSQPSFPPTNVYRRILSGRLSPGGWLEAELLRVGAAQVQQLWRDEAVPGGEGVGLLARMSIRPTSVAKTASSVLAVHLYMISDRYQKLHSASHGRPVVSSRYVAGIMTRYEMRVRGVHQGRRLRSIKFQFCKASVRPLFDQLNALKAAQSITWKGAYQS
jgi:hypothetical protein